MEVKAKPDTLVRQSVLQRLILSGLASLIGDGNGVCVNIPTNKDNYSDRHGTFLIYVKDNSVKIYTAHNYPPTDCVFKVEFVNKWNFRWFEPFIAIPSPTSNLPLGQPRCEQKGLISFNESFKIYEIALCCLLGKKEWLAFDVTYDAKHPKTELGKYTIYKVDNRITIRSFVGNIARNQLQTDWMRNEIC